jgi:hypothetical protein
MSTKEPPIDLSELQRAFTEEMIRHKDRELRVVIVGTPGTMIGILGMMQLTLRHPAIGASPSAYEFAQVAKACEEILKSIGPATARIASMGCLEKTTRCQIRVNAIVAIRGNG